MHVTNESNGYLMPGSQPRRERSEAPVTALHTAQKLGGNFLHKLQPAEAQDFLVRHIARRLSQLGSPGTSDHQALQRLSSTHNRENAIRALMEQGQQLQNQGVPGTKVKHTLQEGHREGRDLLENSGRLTQFAKNMLNDFANALDATIDRSGLGQTSLAHQSSSFSQTASIQIQTREGDTVTIDLSHAGSQSSTQLRHQGSGVALQAYETTQRSESSLHIRVEGDLNGDEQKAIERLLGKLEGVADKFQAGNDQGALTSALNVNLDDELAGFSMKLHSEKNQQQIQAMERITSPAAQSLEDIQADIQTLLQQAREQTTLSQDSLREDIRALMQNMLDLKYPQQQDSSHPMLERLFADNRSQRDD